MPATKARQARSTATTVKPSATDVTAARIFAAFEPLHRLPSNDVDLLERAAAGLRFIRSTGRYTHLEHELFCIALAELGAADTSVVESAACWAADVVPFDNPGSRASTEHTHFRTLWFAAVLRVSEAYCSGGREAPDAVFAAWTDTAVYLEFQGEPASEQCLARVRMRTAALEALTGSKVLVASFTARRGAA